MSLGRGRRWLLVVATAGVCAALASAAAGVQPPARVAACQGRYLLQCSEKVAAFNDYFIATTTAVLDDELVETKAPLHLSDPALGQFWRFEASAATACSLLSFEFGNEISDPNFEAIAPVVQLPKVSVKPDRVVDRRLAATLTRLMQAAQQEVVDLQALDIAMNRATAARYQRSREDWVKWQEAAAAGFASRTASALGRVTKGELAAAKAFARHKLLFGVGPVDLKLAQQTVRKHGFTAKLVATMRSLGMDGAAISLAEQGFRKANPGQQSFSLTDELRSAAVIKEQRAFASSLRGFAKRIPPAGKPPS
jgi:hypothetical protein